MMRPKPKKRATMTPEAAEALGLKALLFLVGEEARLGRFLALTGLDPAELRAQAGSPEMLAAILNHLLEDESMLLVFTAGADASPEDVMAARVQLGGTSPWDSV